jgi:uncharacterized membrane protein
MSTQRIEAFSDGVFAIAITLLVLDIRPPHASPHLVADLLALWPSYLAYLISFLLIGLIWANHHEMFRHIRHSDRMLMFFNVLLLMDVAFLPFVTAVLSSSLRSDMGLRTAVILYGSTLVVGGLFFNAVWEWARRGHRLLGDSLSPDDAKAIARRFMFGPSAYLAGTVTGIFLPVLGLSIFAALILFYWLPITHGMHSRMHP